MASTAEAQRRLLLALGQAAKRWVLPRIRSYKGKPIRALQRSLSVKVIGTSTVKLQIPYFWAVYVHDGRKAPVRSRESSFLIWWKDPRKDPRLAPSGVTPRRAEQLRHLSSDQFQEALRQHREAIAQNRESPVVIVPAVKRPTPPSPFFANEPGGGMNGFVNKANEVGRAEARNLILGELKKELGFSTFVPSGSAVRFSPVEDRTTANL